MKKIILFFILSCFIIVSAYAEPTWVNQELQVKGESAINNAYPPGRAKLMAKRGAILDAKRNLLEKVLALKIDNGKTIRNVVPASDVTDGYRSKLISAAFPVRTDYDDAGICTVTVVLNLSNVYNYLRDTGLL